MFPVDVQPLRRLGRAVLAREVGLERPDQLAVATLVVGLESAEHLVVESGELRGSLESKQEAVHAEVAVAGHAARPKEPSAERQRALRLAVGAGYALRPVRQPAHARRYGIPKPTADPRTASNSSPVFGCPLGAE